MSALCRRFFAALAIALSIWPAGLSQAGPAEGLSAAISEARIRADRRAVVTIKLSDGNGLPIELADLDADSVKFTIAVLQSTTTGANSYHNYIVTKVAGKEYIYGGETRKPFLAETAQPDFDARGTLTRLRPGLFTYTFKTAVPANYDRNATHVIGGELTRGDGKYVANPLFEFVPSGGRVQAQRAVVDTASCNNCHDPLKYHGGSRRNVGYCALCHTSQLTDPETAESLEFKVFVHKIHRGRLLPSVKEGRPFFIVGAEQKIADYSNLRYTQVAMSDGNAKDLRNCKACHAGAKQDNWKTAPGVAACTSCHTNVDLATGTNHALGPQAEGSCAGCHLPDGPEFGPSVTGAHTYPGWSTQLAGIVFDILKVENTVPGQSPAVTFSVKNKKGEPLDANKLDNLRLVIAWPTSDYKVSIEEDARKAESRGN
jgi:OmcA/MtrC family decaheme c-type cytochrome